MKRVFYGMLILTIVGIVFWGGVMKYMTEDIHNEITTATGKGAITAELLGRHLEALARAQMMAMAGLFLIAMLLLILAEKTETD